MSTSTCRAAGIFLLLTALATAISVLARLAADADATPLTDALAQSQSLAAVEIARLEVREKLSAIGSASVAYGTGGVARLVGGLTLLAAGLYLKRAMGSVFPQVMAMVAVLLAASGIASAVSGGAAIALAAMAEVPGPSRTYTFGIEMPWAYGGEQTLFWIRWFAGALGFALAGLALVAMAPAQWRMGGILRVTAVVDAVLGVAMLFIWVDAATVVHRVTGIAFLIWLIVVGLWLVVPRLRTIGMPTSAAR